MKKDINKASDYAANDVDAKTGNKAKNKASNKASNKAGNSARNCGCKNGGSDVSDCGK